MNKYSDPFGMIMPDRKFQGTNYQFGFNGKENDDEVKGFGNEQDYGMRIYDPRLGRFLSSDPLEKEYPSLTPYQFAGNMPIQFIDLDGLEPADPRFATVGGYRRGKRGEKIAAQRFINEDFLTPYLGGAVYPSHIAQAKNFADAIGGSVYTIRDYPGDFDDVVQVRVSKSSEIVKSIVSTLRDTYKLDLSEDFLATVITDQLFVFLPDQDYSDLFWVKSPTVLLNQVAGAIAISRPISLRVLPNVGVNTENADIVVNATVINGEISKALASVLMQFAKKKERVADQKEGEAALNQLEGIENAQENAKQNKEEGQKKQNKINKIDKSKQRLKKELKDVKTRKDAEEKF